MIDPDYICDPAYVAALTDTTRLQTALTDIMRLQKENLALGAAVQKAAMALGSTDEWSDHNSMIADFEQRFGELVRSKRGPTPSHTDLMVPPESIDAFMEANPLPPDQEEKTT